MTAYAKPIRIISLLVSPMNKSLATSQIINLAAKENRSGYICLSNVHMCMEAYDSDTFARIVNSSIITLPDGRPIYWALRARGKKECEQTRGIDLLLEVCKEAETQGIDVGFFGGSDEVVQKISQVLRKRFPDLNIVFTCAPPYLESGSDPGFEPYCSKINNSGAQVLFVGLGCPKQEIWMAHNKDKLNCVLVGVGAAFDYLAGQKNQPHWIVSSIGFEWLYRFILEPRRLFHRYARHNPRFMWLIMSQSIRQLKKKTMS